MNSFDLYKYASTLIQYNPITGAVTWLARNADCKSNNVFNALFAGKKAGTIDSNGYCVIFINIYGKLRSIKTHRLAWFIANGELPVHEIDHINRNRSDNRILNLRDVPKRINLKNKTISRNNTSGLTGVTWFKRLSMWRAGATVDGKYHSVGYFHKKEDAERNLLEFRAKNEFTTNHGAL